jgi:glycosyltransferase involved in cell wall biosynthesis
MKVLIIHNSYQQPGGEDAVVVAERQLLMAHGDTVIEYRRHNDELQGQSKFRAILAGTDAIWSPASHRALGELLTREKPEVAHIHNIFPLISPSAYYACAESGVPVVQTLHNYRLLCAAATFLREGRVCEGCLGPSLPWPGVVHACYRDSRLATAAVAGMLVTHRALHTWKKKVNAYIALSEFARNKFIEGGLPSERIVVKQNFVHPDPRPKGGKGQYALCVGRLSEEKGIRILLSAWSALALSAPLRIAGDGPLREEVVSEIARRQLKQADLLGPLPTQDIFRWMHGARFLVFPSVCFENFPLAVAEAFACGLPVIASRLGAMQEIVADGKTGLHFTPGDPQDLAAKIEYAWTHPEEMQAMGQAARAEYEAKYTAEHNYQQLMRIYARAIVDRQKTGYRVGAAGILAS